MSVSRHWVMAATLLVLLPTCLAAQKRVDLPTRDKPLSLSNAPVFRVGAADGTEWETFAGIFDVAFDRAGNLYVLDAPVQRIHVFDPSGRHLRSIGRRGEGPGEFIAPVGLAVDRDGRLIVNDMAKGGLQVLTTDGVYVGSMASDGGRRIMGRIRAHPQGGIVGETSMLDTGEQGLPSSTPPRSVTWLTTGTPASRRLYNAPPQPVTQTTNAPKQVGRIVAVGTPGFSPRLHWALLPGGLVAGHTAEYTLTVSDNEGRPQRVLQRAIQPRQVTQRDRDRLNQRRQNQRAVVVPGSSGRMGSLPGGPPPITTFAAVVPVISGIAADPAGRIWIRRGEDDEAVVDIVTSEGDYLGTIRGDALPSAFGPGGLAAYIEEDELGVPVVSVKRIELPANTR